MQKVDLIIFDLDGTLVDSKKDIVKAVNFTLSKLGLEERSFKDIVSFIGTGVKSLISLSLGQINKSKFSEAMKIFEEYYKNYSIKRSDLYPKAAEILELFKDKAMVIVTNRKRDMALLSLKKLGIDKYFKEVIGGDDETCLKPSSCQLKKAFKWVKDKNKSIIIGDMDLDILAGRAAGICTCGVTYGIGNIDDIIRAKPDYLIHDLWELKNILK